MLGPPGRTSSAPGWAVVTEWYPLGPTRRRAIPERSPLWEATDQASSTRIGRSTS